MKAELFNVFNPIQVRAIKDAIIHGAWGGTDMEFYGCSDIPDQTHRAFGYCTNDIYRGGSFKNRRSISGVISGISKMIKEYKLGFIITCSDWWGDGTGDMLFINLDAVEAEYEDILEWAKNCRI